MIEQLSKYFEAGGEYLEIGPLDSPRLRKEDCNVYYMDYSSTEEIKKRYENSYANLDKIVEIDYPTHELSYSKATGGKKFDSVFSSHCIEHTLDLIGHLQEVSSILKDGGRYVIIVPDGDNYGDFNRQNTTFREVYNVYKERQDISLFKLDSFLDGTKYECSEDTQYIYHNRISMIRKLISEDYEKLENFAQNVNSDFWGGHVWKFNYVSILEILRNCLRLNLIDFELEYSEVCDTENSYNIYLVLKKNVKLLRDNESKRKEVINIQQKIDKQKGIEDSLLERLSVFDGCVYIYGINSTGVRVYNFLNKTVKRLKFVVSDGQPNSVVMDGREEKAAFISEINDEDALFLIVADTYPTRQIMRKHLEAKGYMYEVNYFVM
jgi:SAM-dependent methyltransferase